LNTVADSLPVRGLDSSYCCSPLDGTIRRWMAAPHTHHSNGTCCMMHPCARLSAGTSYTDHAQDWRQSNYPFRCDTTGTWSGTPRRNDLVTWRFCSFPGGRRRILCLIPGIGRPRRLYDTTGNRRLNARQEEENGLRGSVHWPD
jgi:hypothetical protein